MHHKQRQTQNSHKQLGVHETIGQQQLNHLLRTDSSLSQRVTIIWLNNENKTTKTILIKKLKKNAIVTIVIGLDKQTFRVLDFNYLLPIKEYVLSAHWDGSGVGP